MSNLNQNTASLRAVLDTINALPSKVDTSGTATAADIFTGKTATVNDAKLTGTNPYNAANVDPAVADALAALVEKGMDTTGAGLAELAGLIAAIEAGGGGITSEHFDIAFGSFITADGVIRVKVDCGFPISATDGFFYLFGSGAIVERTASCNVAGYAAYNITSGGLVGSYGTMIYASGTATSLSSVKLISSAETCKSDCTETEIYLYGYGAWHFIPECEYFWILAKEKVQ